MTRKITIPAPPIVEEFVRWLYRQRAPRELDPRTIRGYEIAVLRLVEWASKSGRGEIETLTSDDLMDFTQIERRSDPPGAAQRRNASIKAFYRRFLIETGVRKDDPSSVLPGVRRPKHSLAPVGQLSLKIAKLDETDRKIAYFIRLTRDRLKIGEAFNVREERPIPSEVRVRNEKGRLLHRRPVPIPPRAQQILDEFDGRVPKTLKQFQITTRAANFTPKELHRPTRSDVSVELHPALTPLILDDLADWNFEDAARKAMTEVEQRLRSIAGGSDARGITLVNQVFSANGSLATEIADDRDREALRNLFAGAFGYVRNPLAHQHVAFPDSDFGAEVVLLGDLLLRALEGFELRMATR